MNAFIPTLIAVLLAEFGARATVYAKLPRSGLAATVLGMGVATAAFGGNSLFSTMSADARSLLLGIALMLTGFGQFGKTFSGDPPATIIGTCLFVWRSSVFFLAFAFSVWTGAPWSAAVGALAGFAGAAVLSAVPFSQRMTLTLRTVAGLLMTVLGIYTSALALRLTG